MDDHAGPLPVDVLEEFVTRIFQASGLTPEDARVVAAHLVDAEAREYRSQGLMRVAGHVAQAQAGRVRSGAPLTVERDAGAVLVLDAHNGWGHPSALRAMDLCIERAADAGACLAIVRRTNHIGRLGHYVEHAASRGMIGLIASGGNRTATSAPAWGGARGVFGTNPLALGFPRRDGPPVVVDISTTQTAAGNIVLAQRTGQPIPDGWAYDAAGLPTRDPHAAWPHGTLAPLGGHKGYALAVAVEVLCGVLSAGAPGVGRGNFLGAIRVDAFLPRDDYERSLEELAARIKSGPMRPGVTEILLPGEGGARRRQAGAARGVTVAREVWAEVVALARSLGVEHPVPAARPEA